jgi:hypothetical protein
MCCCCCSEEGGEVKGKAQPRRCFPAAWLLPDYIVSRLNGDALGAELSAMLPPLLLPLPIVRCMHARGGLLPG